MSTIIRRVMLWALALVVDLAVPWLGFRLPGLGASSASEWDVEGEHLAEFRQARDAGVETVEHLRDATLLPRHALQRALQAARLTPQELLERPVLPRREVRGQADEGEREHHDDQAQRRPRMAMGAGDLAGHDDLDVGDQGVTR